MSMKEFIYSSAPEGHEPITNTTTVLASEATQEQPDNVYTSFDDMPVKDQILGGMALICVGLAVAAGTLLRDRKEESKQ